MLFKKQEEIRDLLLLDKQNFFVNPVERVLVRLNGETFTKCIDNRFFFNNDNIFDKEIDDYVTLKDVLMSYSGYGYFESDQYDEAEYIANKYGLKVLKDERRVVDDYDEYLGSVELDHHETIYRFERVGENV